MASKKLKKPTLSLVPAVKAAATNPSVNLMIEGFSEMADGARLLRGCLIAGAHITPAEARDIKPELTRARDELSKLIDEIGA